MAIEKVFQRYSFTDADLNVVLQDYRRKINEVIDYFLDTDFGNLALYDTDKSDVLNLKWNENDSNPRDLNFKINKGDRTISLSANLTVEGASLINSDLTTDANWATSGTFDCGIITTTGTQAIKLVGTGTTGNASLGYIGFFDSNGSTRRGYIGDASSNDDDIYLAADTGKLRLLAAEYINLGTHTYFLDDVVMSFGASLDYSIGFAVATDTLQIVNGSTLGSNIRLKLDSSGNFDFGAGNLITTGTIGAGSSAGANTSAINIGVASQPSASYEYGLIGEQNTSKISGIALKNTNANGEGRFSIISNDGAFLSFTMGNSSNPNQLFGMDRKDFGGFWTNMSGTGRVLLIGSYTNEDLVFGTNNTQRMRVLAGGNVQINNNLIIQSGNEARFYDVGNSNYVGFEAPALGANFIWKLPAIDGLGNDVLGTDAAGQLIWITGTSLGNVVAAGNFGTDNVLIRSDGTGKGVQHSGIEIDNSNNITGIGKIEIQDGTDGTSAKGIYMWQTTDTNWGIYMGQAGAGKSLADGVACASLSGETAHHIRSRVDNGATNGFIWENSSEVCLMSLEGDTGNLNILGNVGIGVAPTAKLCVEKDTGGTYDSTTVAAIFGDIDSQDNIYIIGSTINAGYNYDNDAFDFWINYRGHDGGVTRFRDFTVGDGKGATVFSIDGSAALATLTGNLTMSSATSTITGGTQFNLEAGASGIRSVTINNDTTTSAVDCRVGNAGGQFMRSTSSLKYKTNVKDLEVDSSIIYQLRPVSFTSACKGDDKKKRFVGLIAEEVEQIYPDMADYNEYGVVQNYDTNMLATLMLAEIQKLNKRVEQLENK